jgi:polyisoprenoid-binding protein YceI
MKTTYEIDPAHSSVQFSIRHLMVTNVRGSFKGVKGTVTYDPDSPATSTVRAIIDAGTISTNDNERDAHVKGADFLDVERYPTIEFKSTSVKKSGATGLEVTGDLTVHGITKPVVLNVEEISPETKDPWGNTRIGASAKTKIKRSDFGLKWNAPLETGGVLVGDDVKLEFELEFVKAKTATA